MSRLSQLKTQLSGIQLDCDYWDVRIEDTIETRIDLQNDELISSAAAPSLGAFLRVRKNSFWLYEATTNLQEIRNKLISLAEQSVPTVDHSAFPSQKQNAFVKIQHQENAFSLVNLEKKVELARAYRKTAQSNSKVKMTSIRYRDLYKIKSFLNSVGTEFEYDFNQAGVGIFFKIKEEDFLFEDYFYLYATKFDELKNKENDLLKHINESEEFLRAPAIEPGKYRVLLNPEVAGVFTHESFGHKSEADFIIGNDEALEEWKLGKQIASTCLSIVDCGSHENTSGYCPIDDEGTLAQKNYLIKNGILTGRLHSIDTAGKLSEVPTGNGRAMSFEWEPIVRMTSTYIEPGTESLDSIMKRSEGAIYIEGYNHGSGLSTFTIGPIRGYVIGKNGTKKPVRLSVISGSVTQTLKDIEAVSSDFALKSSAIGGCGKMEQFPLPIADGGPYVLIREMQVS